MRTLFSNVAEECPKCKCRVRKTIYSDIDIDLHDNSLVQRYQIRCMDCNLLFNQGIVHK